MDRIGLDPQEAAARLLQEGPNEWGHRRRRGFFRYVCEMLADPVFLMLIAAGAIYWMMGDAVDAAVLSGFVVIIMSITVFHRVRTDRVLAHLRELGSPRTWVVRGGKQFRVSGVELVRGDLVLLGEGDRVPADGSVIEAHEFALDESMLSGESVPVNRLDAGLPVFAGTLVTRGQAWVNITATGTRTCIGKLGQSVERQQETVSPLQLEVSSLTRLLAVYGLGLSLLLALVFAWQRGVSVEALLAAISLAMAVLPQEFPVIMTVMMAFGARRLAAGNVLARRFGAIEALGETSVLCVDKTGTLTLNRMQLAALSLNGERVDVGANAPKKLPESFEHLLHLGLLASEARPHDPMENAFFRCAEWHDVANPHADAEWCLVQEYELSSHLLAMTHVWRHRQQDNLLVVAKGAPEAVMDLCHLDAVQAANLAAEAAVLAGRGMRVLGLATASHVQEKHRRRQQDWPRSQHDFDFVWAGLVGIIDPLRPEAKEAVAQLRAAGIRVVMITGDHPETALALARECGIDDRIVMTGDMLEDAENALVSLQKCCVFARISPMQKLQIVEALKTAGDIVAMTGDGINDAPALRSAHVGIAMGLRGTDVAREAASLVLLNDDFTAIVHAVGQGRRIFTNLRRALLFTLAVHVPFVVLSAWPVMSGGVLLLFPVHIAFLEIVIDPACSVVFEAERMAPGDMRRLMQSLPRKPGEPLLSGRSAWYATGQGVVVSAFVLLAYQYGIAHDMQENMLRCVCFIVLVLADAMLLLSLLSVSRLFRFGFPVISKVAFVLLLAMTGALFVVVEFGPLAGLLHFTRPDAATGMVAVTLGFMSLLPLLLMRYWLERWELAERGGGKNLKKY